MSRAKPAAAAAVAALVLSACGSTAKPVAGSAGTQTQASSRGKVDDPRTNNPNHVKCLQQHHLPVTEIEISGLPSLQIGTTPSSPAVMFVATPGIAQGAVIQGLKWAQGAEVIGSSLLFPNDGSDSELKTIEDCLSKGVTG
jgi:hypothetical protein